MGGQGPACTRDCDGAQGPPRSDSRVRLRVGESPPPASPLLEGDDRGPPTHVGAPSLGRLGTRLVADERGHGAEAPRDPTLARVPGMASRPPRAVAEESAPPPAPSSRPRVEGPPGLAGGTGAKERGPGEGPPRVPARVAAEPPGIVIRGGATPLASPARPRSGKPPDGAGGERARGGGGRGRGGGSWGRGGSWQEAPTAGPKDQGRVRGRPHRSALGRGKEGRG